MSVRWAKLRGLGGGFSQRIIRTSRRFINATIEKSHHATVAGICQITRSVHGRQENPEIPLVLVQIDGVCKYGRVRKVLCCLAVLHRSGKSAGGTVHEFAQAPFSSG